MGVKKNILYSSFLTLSNYIFGLITFPYVTRVLGVSHLGTVDFVTNIVAYFILLASLGITTVGGREVAKVRNNHRDLNHCFSSLLVLNLIFTFAALLVFLILIFSVRQFVEQRDLFLLGALQVLSTTFMVEWLFRGLENFRYITIRNLVIKIFYVIAVFLFVRDSNDYILYFLLTVVSVCINAVVNSWYARRFVHFSWKAVSIKPYLKSSIFLGAYNLLTSMYTTFNVAFLGFMTTSVEVGYYTTALKLYTIVMGLYTAFTTVMMPHGAALLANGEKEKYISLVDKSFEALYTLSFPLLIFCTMLAPQIIEVLAGAQFEGSVTPMRIVMPLLFVVGMAQILALQVIIPIQKDSWTLRASVVGAIVGISLNILLVPRLQAIGTSIALLCTEFSVSILYICVVWRGKFIDLKYKTMLKHVACALPYIAICALINSTLNGSWAVLCISGALCGVYFVISQIFVLKNPLFLNLWLQWRNN